MSSNNRYYLHRKVKQNGFRVNSRMKTVYIPFTVKQLDKYCTKLRDVYNYNIQLELV